MSIIGFIYVIHRSFLGRPIFYLKAMFLLYISKLVLTIISTLNNIRENGPGRGGSENLPEPLSLRHKP